MIRRAHFWLFLATLVAACLLQLAPLPALLLPFKPYWLALVLIYWSLEEPDNIGLGRAFLFGLVGDVLQGDLLGDQALRLVALVFIVLRFRARLRFFPIWQQSLAVLGLLLNDRVLSLMVRAFSGAPLPPLSFWYAPVIGMLAWPWIFLLIDDLRARLRVHEA
ncbi:rod shape-determining protein MreD [Tahibacter amnicola]|uniref:Rod shape-determining protein MreD n=1 Tax=Tahibacter amnicola TaxID=2976241 RepID=A0ABY6BD83_9GAMM|nr:rod shape-determining protein MreD [Tahibacter amnicola]UXI68003.1 rod shape-determining protein MreD [Tahibacter amnicola]